ncbi:DUF2934 domain-containing protein [Thiocystis violacea]|uniref:DUF2934 domain-containing protein n=1 Tax=Thiocystis violacea TaxID=13725 RepID=UPI001907F0EB|nr:DUF2934 domain-containing protein [Thiocystis violacea]MBK1716915.1 hypothetical protein [Thiocystis violacea]
MKSQTADRPTAPQRHEMIAIAAYYLAEHRGFAPGDANADWFEAERAIDAMIADRRLSSATNNETRHRIIRNALVLQSEERD